MLRVPSAHREFRSLILCLCGAFERHDRQVLATTMVFEVDRESISGLASDKRLRPRASRRTRPAFTSFDARSPASRSLTEVDFIRRLAIERCMRAMFVVPVGERKKLATACFSFLRQQNPSRALVLQTSDQTLDDGDAPVLADSAVTGRLDSLPLDPAAECSAVEDAVSVTDNVLGGCPSKSRRSSEERTNGTTIRPSCEDCDVHHAS